MNIADLAAKYRVSRMVMISAANARHPENAMEYSKRVAEMYVQSSYCRLKRDKGDRKSTRLNSSHTDSSRMPSSA